MALTVAASPIGGRFTEFVRIDIEAKDDGTGTVISGPFEILFTLDGSVPSDTNSATTIRRSPIRRLPLDGPQTLKFFARTVTTPVVETDIQVEFYDIIELTAKNTIRTAPLSVTNYTLKIANGDVVRNDDGFYDIVSGRDKTSQDVREVILVEDVPNGEFIGTRTLPDFGSALNRIVGQSFPVSFAASRMTTSIFEALTTLIALERESNAPKDEQIRNIVSVNVVPQSEGDPTSYRYHFVVETVGGATVSGSGLIIGG